MNAVEHRKTESTHYEERTGNFYYSSVEDVTDALNSNMESQADPNNGFTAERTMRKVADIPVAAFYPWAKKVGYNHMDRQQRKMALWSFLAEHPEYRTVTALKHNTVNQGSIFIK